MLPYENLADDAGAAPMAPRSACFVRVVVERALDRGDGLTYWTEDPVERGRLVEVPIGRGDTTTPGVVVRAGGAELADTIPIERIKPITRVLALRLTALQLDLCAWIASYYACPLGMVFAAAIPRAVRAQTGRRSIRFVAPAAPLPDPPPPLPPAARDAWAAISALDPGVFPIEKGKLKRTLGLKSIAPIHRLRDEGLVTERESSEIRTPKLFRVLDEPEAASAPEPTNDQRAALDGIGAALDRFGVHLIHGVTGSGKTELYMRLMTRVLDAGKTALVLVPEIALTPQTAGRFVARFREAGVALLHSGMSASARHAQWSLVDSGQARVVVGARSALFAPMRDLGLVVVDEEHDASYKQDRAPRYHARDAAIKLAQLAGCPAVLGSATPSLESWANARSGRSSLWTLARRASGASMPTVEIVDLTRERPERVRSERGNRAAFPIVGPTLERAVHETLERGEQALLMLNRRGYASLVGSADPACDWVLRCDACDCAMVVHKSSVRTRRGSRFVRCHHCGAERLIPSQCPVTGKGVAQIGVGTQRAEDEIMARFGERHRLTLGDSFVRVDSDSMTRAGAYFETLGRFKRGDIRLMLGTQMIAKGLDFPDVTLVGVLSADTALAIPDFRAEERTFQLVAQVAGRAGRGRRPGRVLVQTVNPRSPAIAMASRHDAPAFADHEIAIRERSGLPPAARLARIICRDPSAERAQARARDLASALAERADPRVQITGPMECVMARIADHARWEVELCAPSAALVHAPIDALRAEGALSADASLVIDIDPVWML